MQKIFFYLLINIFIFLPVFSSEICFANNIESTTISAEKNEKANQDSHTFISNDNDERKKGESEITKIDNGDLGLFSLFKDKQENNINTSEKEKKGLFASLLNLYNSDKCKVGINSFGISTGSSTKNN